ncbi:MAG: hypothetical protein E7505_05250 [Ruminococcus sp.]|nr:hypothetical protein [Ruminococcus sp.]
MKIDHENVQISRALFIQLVKFFGTCPECPDPEAEARRQFIISELNTKLEKMKKRDEYKKAHHLD